MAKQTDVFKEARDVDITLTFPFAPRPWSRTGVNTKGKRPVMFNPDVMEEYYGRLRREAAGQLPEGWTPFDDQCELYLYLGKEWSRLRVVTVPGEVRILRGDLSNYLKAHEDALQYSKKHPHRDGILWMNDKQVKRVHVIETDAQPGHLIQR